MLTVHNGIVRIVVDDDDDADDNKTTAIHKYDLFDAVNRNIICFRSLYEVLKYSPLTPW